MIEPTLLIDCTGTEGFIRMEFIPKLRICCGYIRNSRKVYVASSYSSTLVSVRYPEYAEEILKRKLMKLRGWRMRAQEYNLIGIFEPFLEHYYPDYYEITFIQPRQRFISRKELLYISFLALRSLLPQELLMIISKLIINIDLIPFLEGNVLFLK